MNQQDSKKLKITAEEVKHVAKLANLSLSENEIERFREQLGETLDYIGHLSSLKISKVKPTSQVSGLENVFREDKIKSSLSQKEVLVNGSNTDKGYFIGKKVWD